MATRPWTGGIETPSGSCAIRPEMQAAEAAARKAYYTRTYNCDSSMAAALSLPYLLLQTRWCRYMISCGWVGATPEEAEAYCRAGNPRQQLYIGRMHPGITPYARLAELEKHLRATVGLNRYFRKSSRMVVEQLAEILGPT